MNKLLTLLLFTLIGFASAPAQGQNRAVGLDGTDDYVNMGDVLNDVTIPFTFSAWIYWRGGGSPNGALIVTSDNHPDFFYQGFTVGIQPEDRSLSLGIGDGGIAASFNRRNASSPSNTIPVDEWTHIAGIFRGLTDMSLYINGVDQEVTYAGSGGNMVHTSHPFVIGRYTYTGGDDRFFDGAIDEARLWDRALSQNEIQELKDVTLDASYYNNPDNGLIGYWRFNQFENLFIGDDGADDFRDFSLRANHGDAVNGPVLVSGAPVAPPQNFNLAMTPTGPLTVPSGGQVSFDYTIANNTTVTATGDFYFVARRNGNPVAQSIVLSGSLPGEQTIQAATTINVPGVAPPGNYELTFSIGNAFSQSVDDVTYTVTVQGTARDQGSLGWSVAEASPWTPVEASVDASLPEAVTLAAPYPNPASARATISFALPEAGAARLAVYDVLGREVTVLVDETREAGVHTATFDARDLAGGLYLVRLEAGGTVQTQRITLVK